jgi:predicted RNA-binding Zn ribbon-like protein
MVMDYQPNRNVGYTDGMRLKRPSAPGELGLVERFVNDMRSSTPSELLQWFVANGLAESPRVRADEVDLANAVALRETFRSLLAANNGVPLPDGTATQINRALVRCRVRPVVDEAGNTLGFTTAADGVEAILGRYLCAMLDALADGTWSRFKACWNEECRWAFYDRSRNHAGTWCEMATCGSVHKMRRHRARKRAASAQSRAAGAGAA